MNRAFINEMSKRFLTTGRDELREIEQQLVELEQDLDKTREEIIMHPIRQAKRPLTSSFTPAKILEITRDLEERYTKSRKLERAIKTFCNNVADKHQPAQKLHEATVHR